MGLVMNKPLPLFLNDVLKDFNCPENIPIYKGGPLSTDTLFYLHTLKGITGALPIGKGFYLNGDFEAIKNYIMQGNSVKGRIRFFLGYSGWEYEQLDREIEENTWLVGKENISSLMDEGSQRHTLEEGIVQAGEQNMKYGRVSPRFQRSISVAEKLQQYDILIAPSYAPPLPQKPATHKTAGFEKADTCLIIHRNMDYQLLQI